MNDRIKSIDGWRVVAAMGVLYAHSWTRLSWPPLQIAGLDFMQVLNLWGSGVHLFFVISGFCFFLVLSKQPKYDLRTAMDFWKKRWLRIAPAFYVACVAYALASYSLLEHNLSYRLFFNFIFLQNEVPNAEIAGLFWSLAVEWHFYLLLPLIFLQFNRLGIGWTISTLLFIHLVLNLLHYSGRLLPGDNWQYTIFANIGHFAWGLLLGYFFSRRKRWGFLTHSSSILIGLTIAYVGKIFFFSHFVIRMRGAGFIFQSIGPVIMTLGFACMLYSCLENKFLSAIMGNKYLSSLGRVSYSFYLWHGLILGIVFGNLQQFIPRTAGGLFLLMFLTLIVLIPISYVSYNWLESFYFRRQAKLAKVQKI